MTTYRVGMVAREPWMKDDDYYLIGDGVPILVAYDDKEDRWSTIWCSNDIPELKGGDMVLYEIKNFTLKKFKLNHLGDPIIDE